MASIFDNTGFKNLFTNPWAFDQSDNDEKQQMPNDLLAFLYDKHTAEYNQYKFKLNAEKERVLQEELAIQKAKEEEEKRFSIDKAVHWAQVYLKKEIDGIASKHGYDIGVANKRYQFLVGEEYRYFYTFEFAESFARITGLKFTTSSVFASELGNYLGSDLVSYSLAPIGVITNQLPGCSITELKLRVDKLEDLVDIVNTKPDRHSVLDAIKLVFSTLGTYGPK